MDLSDVAKFIEPLFQPGVYWVIIIIFLGTLALVIDYMIKDSRRKAAQVNSMQFLKIQDMQEIKPFRRPEQEQGAPENAPEKKA